MTSNQKNAGNYIKLKNGNIIRIESLSNHVPFIMIRINPIFLEICEFIADNFYEFRRDSTEWEVLVNFLSLHSEKTKIITAVVLLSRIESISEINVSYIGSEFSFLFEYDIYFHNSVGQNSNFINKSRVLSSFIKYFPNRLYFSLKNKKIEKTTSVIRSWVDVDEELHKKHINEATIYIYPFGINLERGFRFIKHCFKRYKNVSLMGVPYSLKLLIKILFSSREKMDYAIINYEIEAMKRHSKEFKYFDYIYTSDEFIPAINSLYSEFLSNKSVINNAHGIGFYNPYIKYTKMIVFNNSQKDYYQKRNSSINYSIKYNNNIELTKFDKTLPTNIIYIDQGNLTNYGLLYEDRLQHKVISKLEEIHNQMELKCFIKFHPNRKLKEKKLFLKNHNIFKEIRSFNNYFKINFIFINLYSTAYYDFKKYGNFLFIKEDFFDPSYYFGKTINVLGVKELEYYLKDLMTK